MRPSRLDIRHLSLFQLFLAGTTATVVVALAIAGILVRQAIGGGLAATRTAQLSQRAQIVGTWLSRRADHGPSPALRRRIELLLRDLDGRLAALSPQGRVLWRVGAGRWPPVAAIARRYNMGQVMLGNEVRTAVHLRQLDLALVLRPWIVKGRVVGVLLVEAPLGARPLISEATRRIALAGAVGLLVATGLLTLLARRIDRPLTRLAEHAGRIAAGDFGPLPPLDGPRELQHLASSLDRMRAELAERLRRQEAFLAEVAHELRTPLTGLRANLEALASDLAGRPGMPYLVRSLAEVDRLRRLVSDLLDLDRVREGLGWNLAPRPLDASEALARCVLGFEGALKDHNVRVSVDLAPQAKVLADPDRLTQILANLIDNALHHVPSGGRLHLEVRALGPRVLFAVENSGRPLEPGEGELLFLRFFRGTSGRGGSGLGLAIVRSLVEAHGGEVRARNGALGPRFEVLLPAAETPSSLREA